jgi:GNAT superfamily N-acetyltransferase
LLSITPLSNSEALRSSTLRARVEAGKCPVSVEFIATKGEDEVGLLIYEDWRPKGLGFIYEINVLLDCRGQGIAKQLRRYAERYAVSLGCKSIGLKAYALDPSTDQGSLLAWYANEGYVPESAGSDRLRKTLIAKV